MDETELEVKAPWHCWMMCVSGPEGQGLAGSASGASAAAFLWGRGLDEASCGLWEAYLAFPGILVPVQLVAQKGVRSQVTCGVFDSEI